MSIMSITYPSGHGACIVSKVRRITRVTAEQQAAVRRARYLSSASTTRSSTTTEKIERREKRERRKEKSERKEK